MSARHETNGKGPSHIGEVISRIIGEEPKVVNKDQPGWKRRPDLAGGLLDFQIHRIGANGEKNLVILSHDIVGADTHYYRSRTRVCIGAACAACRDKNEPRWRGYAFGLRQAQQTIVLFELTPAAMPNLHEWFCAHRTMRGLVVDFARMKGVANGRLLANNLRQYSAAAPLPSAKSIKTALTKLWRLNDQESVELERNEDLGLAPDEIKPEPKSEE